jgi:hypothetical protein
MHAQAQAAVVLVALSCGSRAATALRHKTDASAAREHHPLQPSQQLPDSEAHAEDQPALRSILEFECLPHQ